MLDDQAKAAWLKDVLGFDVNVSRTPRGAAAGIRIGSRRASPAPTAGTPVPQGVPDQGQANPNIYGGATYTTADGDTGPGDKPGYVGTTGLDPQTSSTYVGPNESMPGQQAGQPGQAAQQAGVTGLPQTMGDADQLAERQVGEPVADPPVKPRADAEIQAELDKQRFMDRSVDEMGAEQARQQAEFERQSQRQVRSTRPADNAPQLSADGKYEYVYEPYGLDEDEETEASGSMVGYLPTGGDVSPPGGQPERGGSQPGVPGGNEAGAVQYQNSMNLGSSTPQASPQQVAPQPAAVAQPRASAAARPTSGQIPVPPDGPGPTNSSPPNSAPDHESMLDKAGADVSETSRRLADYAALQVAALAQWEKAPLPSFQKPSVIAGKAEWEKARQAFLKIAKNDPAAIVPDLGNLYVTPPPGEPLDKRHLPPVIVDPHMAELALSLPGKVKQLETARDDAEKQGREAATTLDAITRAATGLARYADSQVAVLAKVEQAALPPFVREVVVAGKAGWTRARDAYAAIRDGMTSEALPDLKSLFVSTDMVTYNKLGLDPVTLDPSKVQLDKSLRMQLAKLT